MRTSAATPFLACLLSITASVAAVQPAARTASPARRQAGELLQKQDPPQITARLMGRLTPGNTSVLVVLSKQRAYLLAGDEVVVDTPISSGKRAGMTPTGEFTITEKDADHRSNIYGDFVDRRTGRVVRRGVSTKIDSAPAGTKYVGAPMKWFMRLTATGVGMHVGVLPGYPASHGCVRLPEEIAALFYQKCPMGTAVKIVE